MFSILRLIQVALIGACFSFGVDAQIMEQNARLLQEEKDAKKAPVKGENRAKNADEGKQYETYTSNKDANVQFEKGFFPYDPGEAYTGYYW